ncbi:MAG TPA: hypothetical protein VFM64_03620, partial [Candidatus Nitrosotenuis sp.]|nr:hypothetical protein [Candidatus Nitrosotenuis sp.]
GFPSKEVPVTIYGNKNNAAKLLMKVTPDTFKSSGYKEGYVSVELADEDGSPVIAKEDTVVSLSTANKDIVDLIDPNLLIKKGEYFAYSKFQIKKSGEALLYATSPGITTQSSKVTVEKDEDLTVKLYTFPKIVSIHDSAKGFIIAQLQDSSGSPVIAQNDISVYYKVTDSSYSDATNLSTNYKQSSSGYFIIKKGSYWGDVLYSLPKGLEDEYDISISTQEPLAVEEETIEAKDLQLMDDKLVKLEILPVLATGNRELIGVIYLEDENGNPVVAKKDLTINIDSSDTKSLSVEPINLLRGDQIALVYGKMGHSVPTDLELRPSVKEGELQKVTVFGPDKDTLELVADPLISKVLEDTNFPIILYLKDGDEVTNFPDDADVFLSPNDYVEMQKKKITQKEGLVIADAKSLKKGKATLSFGVGDFTDDITIDSLSQDPAKLGLDHSKNIFVGTNDIFSVQLLNGAGLPTYATNDVEISIVAKDKGILDAPTKVTISKGNYYAIFDVAPKASGETEISLLSKELPLLKDTIKVTSLNLQANISGPDSASSDDAFVVTASVKANEKALPGIDIQWNVEGGGVQISDTRTGPTGEAAISIIPQSDNVNVKATISGQGYVATTVTKSIQITKATDEITVQENEQPTQEYKAVEIFGIDPVIIIVPVAIGVAGFMMKKKGQLVIRK